TDKRIGRDILVSKESSGEAAAGDLVVARITAYPTPYRNPEARVLRVIGKADDPKIDTEMVIAEFGLSKTFPPEVVSEADALPGKVPERDIKGRKDLRNLKTVTIDGESARDFDDAVSVQKVSGGRIRLWVHIADVGHYVAWDSPLDREARNRGTSVYFPDAVVPMLPERLSNGICSLNPKVDRLTLTAEMLFGPDGRRQDYSVYESVIRSDERMTYTAVKEIIEDRNPDACRRYQSLLDDFGLMEELARRLLDRRREDGSIDFDLPEPEIILDLQGRPTDILKGERYFSHRIIEEFMLAANRTVAEHLLALDVPLIFRTHEPPDPDVVKDFFSLVQSFGLAPPPKNSGGAPKKIHPKVFQGIIEKVRGREEERLVNQVLLRSMKQTRYTMANAGHFGLAFDDYTHFTSPIRRYPDLVVHRILKETFKPRGMTRKRKDQLEHTLPDMARTSSERERTAMEAEREVVDLKKIRFLSDREGEEYFGHISGVTAFGFFVQLEGIFAEGLVHIGSIADDYYIYNDKRHCLTGRHKKKTFQLGNRVQIRIENVDLVRRQADFTLAGEKDSGGRRTAKRGKTPGKPKEATAGNSRNKTKTKGRRKRRRG
ncbi:MAG TPA: ribonuclease R, partial [Nitrospiria bacterium]